MLLLATVFWGTSFTWSKIAFAAANRAAGLPESATFGALFVLAIRFLIAAVIWFAAFPHARRGWTRSSVMRSALTGLLLGVSIVVQSVGLTQTSEAVSAFLTSLTILFVPLLLTFAIRKPPRPWLWVGVFLATTGVWMMTGAQPSGFGSGELLGLLCAFCFSVYILYVNEAVRRDSPWRITAGQFAVTGLLCLVACAVIPGNLARLGPTSVLTIIRPFEVWANTLLLILLATVVSFGLLNHFQPRLDATRAALIYLLEPVFAAGYATWAAGRHLTSSAIAGAAMILIANALVECIAALRPRKQVAGGVETDLQNLVPPVTTTPGGGAG